MASEAVQCHKLLMVILNGEKSLKFLYHNRQSPSLGGIGAIWCVLSVFHRLCTGLAVDTRQWLCYNDET